MSGSVAVLFDREGLRLVSVVFLGNLKDLLSAIVV